MRNAFRPLDWAVGCANLILVMVIPATRAHAQTSPTPPDSTVTVSTQSGVYTAEQAGRGKDVYANLCKSCHNPSVGDAFAKRWAGKTLLDMFNYIFTNMPDNNPGSVDPLSNADIIGYLMQSSGMPVGTHDVPAASDSLKLIRIEIKKDTSSAPKPPTAISRAGSRPHR